VDISTTFDSTYTVEERDQSGNWTTTVTQSDNGHMLAHKERTILDVVVEDFYTKIRSGEIISNPCHKTEWSVSVTPGDYEQLLTRSDGTRQRVKRVPYPPSRILGTLPYNSSELLSPATIDFAHLQDLAVTKAFARVELSEAQILATIGEGKETIESLVSIFLKLKRIVKKAKKLDYRLFKGSVTPADLADQWMEIRYALRPLYYDAKQIIEAINSTKPKPGDILRFTASEKFSEYEFVQDVPYSVNSTRGIYADKSVSIDGKVRAGVLTRLESLSLLNIWGCDSIIETAWELLPFSFIIDWFFNIGDFIASWTPEVGISTLTSWVTTEYDQVQTISFHSEKIGNYFDTYQLTGGMVYTQHVYDRQISPNRPLLPTYDVSLDFAKLVDLAIIAKKLWRK
jgi:hypothetical protein